MEVILKAASSDSENRPSCQPPPLKAFMDDTTVISNNEKDTREILERLDEVVAAAGMLFKPKKSRSLSLRKGKVDESVTFRIANQAIPTVSEEPVKSLGRWYDASLKDTKQGKETVKITEEGLETIDKCGLPGKHKVWCLQFMLIPKLLWPLLIYDISVSTVETMEGKINKYTRKWLGTPPGLTDVALYCRQAKLRLPLKSILEEYKAGKARLLSMLEDSADPVVKAAEPELKSGRKWKVKEATEAAKTNFKMKEIIGHTQTNRKGLGSSKMEWWSKTKGKAKRDMVIQEIREEEERARLQKAVQQSQQGQWTAWESALQRSLSWNDLFHMAPLRISFILRSVYDLLPSNANLVKWGKSEDPSCPLCKERQTVEHVLSSCKTALSQGRYTWRHNQVLRELAEAVEFNMVMDKKCSSKPPVLFKKAGGKGTWPEKSVQSKYCNKGLLSDADDWECAADLKGWTTSYPEVIKKTGLRPDIVVSSQTAKEILLIELTVPYESRIDDAHVYKTEKYSDLAKELREDGFKTKVMAVEVGARGFVAASTYSLLQQLSTSSRSRTRTLKALGEAAEKASSWIWTRRNKDQLNKG